MAQRDNMSQTAVAVLGTLTLTGTTPASSAWFDTRDFDSVTLAALNGVVTDAGTAAGYTFTMEESDLTTAASALPVAAGGLNGPAIAVTLDTADGVTAGAQGYVGNKRYVRLTGVGTTGTSAVVTVIGIGGHAHIQPTTFAAVGVAAT